MAGREVFDPKIYEHLYMRSENVPELSLDIDLTSEQLLAQIKRVLSSKEDILHRDFVHIDSSSSDQTLKTDKPISGGEKSFRVMSWNWLAQSLSSGKDNFVRCPSEALDWEFRRLRLLEEILEVDPDVLCMQEMDHYGFVAPILEKVGYKGSFFPKPDSPCLFAKNSNGPDGCAVFYKVNTFNVVGSESLVLLTDWGKNPTNQVCVLYTLQLISNPTSQVTIATTHLKAKNGWQELRCEQGKYLLKHLQDKVGKEPLIVCGDFNAEPSEPVYSVYADSAIKLKSAYTLLDEPRDAEPLYTTWKIRGAWGGEEVDVSHTIDYMWYTSPSLGVTALLSIPTGDELGPDRLPSLRYPSDHLSLATDFIFL